jgi:hypothetical protein
MAAKRLRVGDLVEITFLDHCEDGDDSLEFTVWGRVENITRTAYKIASWVYHDPIAQARDGNEENENYYIIVKTAVTKKRRLVPKNETS